MFSHLTPFFLYMRARHLQQAPSWAVPSASSFTLPTQLAFPFTLSGFRQKFSNRFTRFPTANPAMSLGQTGQTGHTLNRWGRATSKSARRRTAFLVTCTFQSKAASTAIVCTDCMRMHIACPTMNCETNKPRTQSVDTKQAHACNVPGC